MIVIFDGIGFLIALLIKSSRTASMVTSGIFLTLIFTSGVALPVDSLPSIAQKIAYAFPMYHCIEVVQMLWISEFVFTDLLNHLSYIFVTTVTLMLFLGRVRVKWD